jgi:hypothetical protein
MIARIAIVLKVLAPVFFPIVFAPLFYTVLVDRWIMESTMRPIIPWVIVLTIVFFSLGLIYKPDSIGDYGALLFWAILNAACLGFPAFQLCNCLHDSSPATVVDVEFVTLARRVTFRVAEGPQDGREFECGRFTWGEIGGVKHRFELHQGRLGVWWGRLL